MTDHVETAFDYAAGDQRYVGLLLKSKVAKPKAAVVLLPDWRGQGPLALEHATYLLSLRCVVVIADLYGDGFMPDSPDQVGPMVKKLIDHRDQGVLALASCVDRLRQEIPADVPVLCLGYSAGGMIALDYGRSGVDIDGIILCSALLKTAADGSNSKIHSPVLILQGTQDQVSPMETISAIVQEMDAAGNDVEFVLYTQTHHAFDNPEAGSDPQARLVYSATSAARSKSAIAAFIAKVVSEN